MREQLKHTQLRILRTWGKKGRRVAWNGEKRRGAKRNDARRWSDAREKERERERETEREKERETEREKETETETERERARERKGERERDLNRL